MLQAIRWYLQNVPLQSGKSKLFRLFRKRLTADGPVWCRYDGDIHFCADLDDRIQRHVYLYGGYRTERRHKEFMVSRVRPGATIADIGAHAGYYTLLFAKYSGRQGRVVAFEPNPGNHRILEANVHRNGFDQIELRREVVSDRQGTVVLHLPHADNTGMGSLYASVDNDAGALEVPAVHPGELFREIGIDHLDLVKIDVEGHEQNVLQALARYLEQDPGRAPEVFVEINDLMLRRAGRSPKDLFQVLWDHGYQAYRIVGGRRVEPVDEPFCDSLVYFSKRAPA